MLRFAANIGGGHVKRIFSEYPFRERFDRAAAAGFEAVEFPEPYGEDVHAIRAALTGNGLRQVQFNLPWGDHAAGEVGIANNPTRRVEFRDGVSRALEVADQLGCPRILCHVGITLPHLPLEAQRAAGSVFPTLARSATAGLFSAASNTLTPSAIDISATVNRRRQPQPQAQLFQRSEVPSTVPGLCICRYFLYY